MPAFVVEQNWTAGTLSPGLQHEFPLLVRCRMSRQSQPGQSAVGMRSKVIVYTSGRETVPSRLPCVTNVRAGLVKMLAALGAGVGTFVGRDVGFVGWAVGWPVGEVGFGDG